MAISIKASMNGLAAIKKIGVDESLVQWLVEQPIKVKLTSQKFIFTVWTDVKVKDFYVDVTLNELQQLSAGMLPLVKKAVLRDAINQTILAIQKEFGTVIKGTVPVEPTSLLAKLPPLKPSPSKEAAPPEPKEAWPKFDLAKIQSAQCVKLRDATMMYQPVFGTSAGSRYFMVAANKDLRVAARYKSGKLSVRIEGPGWQKYATNISECGFHNVDKSKDYASIHLDVGLNLIVANKTLGALLMGLGVPLETPLPDLKVIAQ